MLLRADLFEVESELVLDVEAPGVPAAAFDVQVGATWVRVAVDAGSATDRGRPLRRERARGHFVRELALPLPVLERLAEATLDGGVLTLRLPLRRRPGGARRDDAQRIEVAAGSTTGANARAGWVASPD